MGPPANLEHDRRTIYVQGVSYQLQDADFEAAFSEIGPVRKSFLLKDKGQETHKGSGFVQFAVPEDAEKALQQYNGKKLAGRAVQVVGALKRAPFAERKLKKHGKVESLAEAKEVSTAQPPKYAKSPLVDGGDRQKFLRTIALGNLTADTAPSAVKLASSLGKVVEVQFPVPVEEIERAKLRQDGCSGVVVYVTYQKVKMAVDAIAQLHGQHPGTSTLPRDAVKRQQAEGPRLWARQVKGEGAFVKKWRIILRNLPFEVKEDDLHQLLSASGYVWELTIPRTADGKPRGFAFAAFTSRAHAEKAIKMVNGQTLNGRIIAVDWAVSKVAFQTAQKDGLAGDEEEGRGSPVRHCSHDNHKTTAPVLEDANGGDRGSEEDHAQVSAGDELQSEKDLLRSMAQHFAAADGDADQAAKRVRAPRDSGDQAPAEQSNRAETGLSVPFEPLSIVEHAHKSKGTCDAVSKTVFVRGLALEVTRQQLQARLESYGEISSCRIVLNSTTRTPKGTAFVQFISQASASMAAKASEEFRLGKGPGISIGGRPLDVSMAVSQADARVMAAQKASGQDPKDNRHLYLAKEGQIDEGSLAWRDMSRGDQQKRTRAAQEKATKLRSPNFYVSPTRLCLRNVPYSMDEKSLKSLLIAAVKERAIKAAPKLKQVKVLRDAERKTKDGRPASKGIAFAEFTDHEDAMCALRQLNNNPAPFGKDRRPIVEFAIENAQTTKKREQREAGKKGHKAAATVTQGRQKRNREYEETISPLESDEAGNKPAEMEHTEQLKPRKRLRHRTDDQVPSQIGADTKSKQLKTAKAQIVKPQEDKARASATGKGGKYTKERGQKAGQHAAQHLPGKRQRTEGKQAPEGMQSRLAKGKPLAGRAKKQKTGHKKDEFDNLIAKYKSTLFGEKAQHASNSRGRSLKRWFE